MAKQLTTLEEVIEWNEMIKKSIEDQVMCLEGEEWKPIEGYENYMVSSYGRVKSLNYRRTTRTQLMKYGKTTNDYVFVVLTKDGKQTPHSIHVLVAKAFIHNDDPTNKKEVNHKFQGGEGKSYNAVENLEWVTRKENMNYGDLYERATATKRKRDGFKKLSEWNALTKSKKVAQIDKKTLEVKKIWDSLIQITRELGYDHSSIIRVCKGKQKTSYGDLWQYI